MKIKEEENSNSIFTVLLVIVVLLFALTCVGCATVYGISSDTEAGAAAVRRWLKPCLDKRDQARLTRAKQEQEARVRKAADLVLAERREQGQ